MLGGVRISMNVMQFLLTTIRATLLVCSSKCLTFEAFKTRTNEQITKTSKIVKMH